MQVLGCKYAAILQDLIRRRHSAFNHRQLN
jgi:hypothetical protein